MKLNLQSLCRPSQDYAECIRILAGSLSRNFDVQTVSFLVRLNLLVRS